MLIIFFFFWLYYIIIIDILQSFLHYIAFLFIIVRYSYCLFNDADHHHNYPTIIYFFQ